MVIPKQQQNLLYMQIMRDVKMMGLQDIQIMVLINITNLASYDLANEYGDDQNQNIMIFTQRCLFLFTPKYRSKFSIYRDFHEIFDIY